MSSYLIHKFILSILFFFITKNKIIYNSIMCDSFDQCVWDKKDQMAYPIDDESLYAQRLYDNQTANRRCYEANPINIEGFGSQKDWFGIIILLVLVCACYWYCCDSSKKTSQTGGLSYRDLSFSNTSPLETFY